MAHAVTILGPRTMHGPFCQSRFDLLRGRAGHAATQIRSHLLDRKLMELEHEGKALRGRGQGIEGAHDLDGDPSGGGLPTSEASRSPCPTRACGGDVMNLRRPRRSALACPAARTSPPGWLLGLGTRAESLSPVLADLEPDGARGPGRGRQGDSRRGTPRARAWQGRTTGEQLGNLEARRSELEAVHARRRATKPEMNAARGRFIRLLSVMLDNLALSDAPKQAIETIRGPLLAATKRPKPTQRSPGAPKPRRATRPR